MTKLNLSKILFKKKYQKLSFYCEVIFEKQFYKKLIHDVSQELY